MGFLSKLFGKGSDRSQWTHISLGIAQDLEYTREYLFRSWVEFLSREMRELRPPGWRVAHSQLGGGAELALKAYQLLESGACLAAHRYLPPDEGADFADLLYAQVCGTQLDAAGDYYHRYSQSYDVVGSAYHHVTVDVCAYILGAEPGTPAFSVPARIAVALQESARALTFAVHIAVANSFGDGATVSHLEEEVRRLETL